MTYQVVGHLESGALSMRALSNDIGTAQDFVLNFLFEGLRTQIVDYVTGELIAGPFFPGSEYPDF